MPTVINPITIVKGGGSLPTPLDPTSQSFWTDFDTLAAEEDMDKMRCALPIGTMIPTGDSSHPYVQVAHYGKALLSNDEVWEGVYLIACYIVTSTTRTSHDIATLVTYADQNTYFPQSVTTRAAEVTRAVYYNKTTSIYNSYDMTYFLPSVAEVAGRASRSDYDEPWDLYLQLVPGGAVTDGKAVRRINPTDSSYRTILCEPMNSSGEGRYNIGTASAPSNAGVIGTSNSGSVSDTYQEACFIPIKPTA